MVAIVVVAVFALSAAAESAAESAAEPSAGAEVAAIATLLVAPVVRLVAVSMMVTESIAHGSGHVPLLHAPLLQPPRASVQSELLEQLRLHASVLPEQRVQQQLHALCRPVLQVAQWALHVLTKTAHWVWWRLGQVGQATVQEAVPKVWGNGVALLLP